MFSLILSRPIADLLIINKAVESSRTVDTALEGDDTDPLILLCYHAELDVLDLFFQPESNANSKRRFWNIKSVKEKLGQEICRHILFIHAISGCDTTSGLYSICKDLPLKKFLSDTHLSRCLTVLQRVGLYNGKPEVELDGLRSPR